MTETGTTTCATAGVPWPCPPGFLLQKPASDGRPTCTPDPALCGDSKYNGLSGPGVIHVDAAAKPGGDGTINKPFAQLPKAVSTAPDGASIAVAAGTYEGPVLIQRPVQVRGRCAAMVRLEAKNAAAITVSGKPAKAPARIEGLHIAGGAGGVQVLVGPKLIAKGLWVDGVSVAGLSLASIGDATLQDSVIHHVQSETAKVMSGFGVTVASGGRLRLTRVHISDVGYGGIVVQGKGSRVSGEEVAIRHSRGAKGWGLSGHGAVVVGGAQLSLKASSVSHQLAWGVICSDPGSEIRLTGVSIRAVVPSGPLANGGAAIELGKGARAVLCGVQVADSGGTGVRAGGKGAELLAGGLVVRDAVQHPHAAVDGLGVVVAGAADGTVSGSIIERARFAGLVVAQAGTMMRGHDLLIRDTRPLPGGDLGRGISVESGASVRLHGVRLHRNRRRSLVVSGPGSELRARRLLIDGTWVAAPEINLPAALRVEKQARAWLTDVRISGNVWSGLEVDAAQAWASGLLVDAGFFGLINLVDEVTGKKSSLALAYGIRSMGGGQLTVAGARSTHMVGASVGVSGADTTLSARGLLVDNTALEPTAKGWGVGLLVTDGAESLLADGVLSANGASGAWVLSGSLNVRDSVITRTRPGASGSSIKPDTLLADGIIVDVGGAAWAERSVFTALPRAGVLVNQSEASGAPSVATLHANIITGCSYGVTAQGGAVAHTKANAIWDNAIANVSTEEGLEVPKAPGAASGP